jgi:hypothetical protein
MDRPKNKKRPKAWHRGRHGSAFGRAMRRWPAIDIDADPTTGEPIPLAKGNRRPK